MPKSWSIDIPVEQFRLEKWKRPIGIAKLKEALIRINRNPGVYSKLRSEEKEFLIRMELGIYLYQFNHRGWQRLDYKIPMRVLEEEPEVADFKYIEKSTAKLELQVLLKQAESEPNESAEKAIYLFLEREGYRDPVLINDQFYGRKEESLGNKLHPIKREELAYLIQLLQLC